MTRHPETPDKSGDVCPYCGRPAPKRRKISPYRRHFTLGIIMVLGSIFFLLWFRNDRITETTAVGPGKYSGLEGTRSAHILSYIKRPDADSSCEECIKAAGKDLELKMAEAERKKYKNMALIPADIYPVGSPDATGDPDEHPLHHVRLAAFYMDKYEVTNSRYLEFVKKTKGNEPEWMKPGGRFNTETGKDRYYAKFGKDLRNGDFPIVGVSWKNADAYCRWAMKRLPTEAEWETAARGGTAARYSFGDNDPQAGEYSWNETNSGGKPNAAGRKKPNDYGLYDMHGNVWEWVQDFYDRKYYSAGPKSDPKGPDKGIEHVIRGGSWAFDADSGRSANRASFDKANDDVGFRCAVTKTRIK
ncbi:MAG: formylglycine-generating enzyme family protein [bacterium]